MTAKDNGRNIKLMINIISKEGGTLRRDCSIEGRFSNKRKIKQPDAISQNLVGIKKYAAG